MENTKQTPLLELDPLTQGLIGDYLHRIPMKELAKKYKENPVHKAITEGGVKSKINRIIKKATFEELFIFLTMNQYPDLSTEEVLRIKNIHPDKEKE